MLRTIASLGVLCVTTTACLAHEPLGQLPPPHYRKKASDPLWLEHVVQLHGHLGPWVVAGARLGMAGAHAVDAKGHFDAEVTCEGPFEKPPRSCFLDGVQLGSGATLGKQSIHVVDAEQIVLKVCNRQTKKAVEVRPSRKLMDILEKKEESDRGEEYYEQIARDIAAMPDAEILAISR